MSRQQKDLLLAKLNQVSENEDDTYERYYKHTSLNQSFDERYQSPVSNYESSESSDSSS